MLSLAHHSFVQVPWYDDRRTPAQAALNATGPDRINPDSLLAVLSTKPVLNLMTTYSIVAQPKTTDVFTHFVRYCTSRTEAAVLCTHFMSPNARIQATILAQTESVARSWTALYIPCIA